MAFSSIPQKERKILSEEHFGEKIIVGTQISNIPSIKFYQNLGFTPISSDYVFHYHIDYVKSNLWKRYNYGPNDQMYWVIHGTDQFLHLMTYVLIIYLLFLPLI